MPLLDWGLGITRMLLYIILFLVLAVYLYLLQQAGRPPTPPPQTFYLQVPIGGSFRVPIIAPDGSKAGILRSATTKLMYARELTTTNPIVIRDRKIGGGGAELSFPDGSAYTDIFGAGVCPFTAHPKPCIGDPLYVYFGGFSINDPKYRAVSPLNSGSLTIQPYTQSLTFEYSKILAISDSSIGIAVNDFDSTFRVDFYYVPLGQNSIAKVQYDPPSTLTLKFGVTLGLTGLFAQENSYVLIDTYNPNPMAKLLRLDVSSGLVQEQITWSFPILSSDEVALYPNFYYRQAVWFPSAQRLAVLYYALADAPTNTHQWRVNVYDAAGNAIRTGIPVTGSPDTEQDPLNFGGQRPTLLAITLPPRVVFVGVNVTTVEEVPLYVTYFGL